MHRYVRWLGMASVAILVTVHPPAWGDPLPAVPVCPSDGHVGERQSGPASFLCVVEDHARREGAFVVLHILVKNVSTQTVADAEVTVEFYSGTGRLLDVEDSVVRPDRLKPGRDGAVLVVAPYRVGTDKIRYLFTWQQAGREHHGAAEHAIQVG